jgi:phosphoribosyl 1,2-cyclic phosphodiesterase
MVDCRIISLYSGSGGNSTYIRVADTAILIDAGKNAKRLCAALKDIGSDISEIRAIFITHDHADHVSALEVLSKKNNIPIHITERSACVFDRYGPSPVCCNLVRHTPVFTEQVGDITVTSFVTPHDSLMSVGYRVEFFDGEEKRAVGLATDVGYVTEDIKRGLCGCEAVVLESNHDERMLINGPYPDHLKKRILSRRGHLSNRDSASLSAYLAAEGTRAFLLAHLSEENNEPTLALEETERCIGDPCISIAVAEPDIPVELRIPTAAEVENDRSKIYNPWNA